MNESKQFQDAEGRTWNPDVTVFVQARIFSDLELNIQNLLADNGKLFHELWSDFPRLTYCIYIACEYQAQERWVSQADFARAIRGRHLFEARDAFFLAVSELFPSPAVRIAFREFVRKSTEVETLIAKAFRKHLAEFQVKLDTIRAEYDRQSV